MITSDDAQAFFKLDEKDNSRESLTGAKDFIVRQVIVKKEVVREMRTYLGSGHCRLFLVPISELVELQKR